MKQIKCIGCGSHLQTDNEEAPGYVKAHLLEGDAENLLCQRCFRIKHYRDLVDVDLTNDDFIKILTEIGNRDVLIVNVVDVFDLSGSIIPNIHRFIGNNDVLLVGNKRDILPKAIKEHNIKNWMRRIVKEYGYKVVDVSLVSAVKGHGIDELLEMIKMYQKNRDVYIIGATNVGKSSLVNAIIKHSTDLNEDVITVSQFPGTTLGLIEIPLTKDHDLVDTPGVINSHQYAFYLDKKTLNKILPKKEIKPKVYQLADKQTLFFAGLGRFDYLKGPKTSFTCYFSNEIKIHRTKLENADNLFKNHVGELLSPPSLDEYKKMGEFVKHEFKIKEVKCDLVISGLGFITIKEPNIHVALYAPKNVGVYIRSSLF